MVKFSHCIDDRVLIVADKFEDDNSCTAVDIKNEFIGYFLKWEMSGKRNMHKSTPAMWTDSAIFKLLQYKWL